MSTKKKLPVLDLDAARPSLERVEPSVIHRPPKRVAPPSSMRSLTFLFRQLQKGMPFVLAAAITPTAGCYLSHGPVGMDAGRDAGPGRRDAGPRPDAGPLPDGGVCGPWVFEERFTVEIPPPGTPADAGLLCVELTEEVSNEAARVTVVTVPTDPGLARATIVIDPDLRARIEGTPSVSVQPGFGVWNEAMVGPVTADGADFSFELRWPYPLEGRVVDMFSGRGDIEVRFELVCGAVATKTVIATTVVHVCLEEDQVWSFASSGEECRTCAIIAEMAPTPILPAERPDQLPLQRAMQLGLRPIAKSANAVVLWAEHGEGDEDVRYEWSSTGGELHQLAPDVYVWTLPDDDVAAAQVVVETPGAVALATWRSGAGL